MTVHQGFNTRLKEIASKAGIDLSMEIEFFGELVAEECADIAKQAYVLQLPAAPIIYRHFHLINPD